MPARHRLDCGARRKNVADPGKMKSRLLAKGVRLISRLVTDVAPDALNTNHFACVVFFFSFHVLLLIRARTRYRRVDTQWARRTACRLQASQGHFDAANCIDCSVIGHRAPQPRRHTKSQTVFFAGVRASLAAGCVQHSLFSAKCVFWKCRVPPRDRSKQPAAGAQKAAQAGNRRG